LVGHSHKITCVRLFNDGKGVITGSADRSLIVWDISRQTYRQTGTFRHSSTANTVDVGIDSTIAVTGHLDGGIRFWDIHSGDRSADIPGKR
jgi:autophagy-related protein 16